MAAEIGITVMRDACNRSTLVSANVSDLVEAEMGRYLLPMVMERIAEAISAEYVKAHMSEILAAIDPQAVANLAVADSAAAIRETVDVGTRKIHEDLGKVASELSRPREVLMPGFFGVRRGVVR